jgi:16S rRNA (adenine1518-N6/adenine1519-N6)-dimethyltransferase
MTNPKHLLDQFEAPPKKSLGQNFLHDPNAVEKIVNTAEIMPDDVVLEIGPGTGALTQVLAQRARRVYSIELDERMRPILNAQVGQYDNVHLIFDDFLKVNVSELVGEQSFRVVANVPYYITSPILMHLFEGRVRPRSIVMTIQFEVAERITATPPDMNRLAVVAQFYGQPEIITKLSPAVFWPRPDVDSAVIKIDIYDEPQVDVPDVKLFFRVVKAGFSQKRKQLKNAVSGGLAIKSRLAGELLAVAGIDPKRRAETLNVEEWAALTRAYAAQL